MGYYLTYPPPDPELEATRPLAPNSQTHRWREGTAFPLSLTLVGPASAEVSSSKWPDLTFSPKSLNPPAPQKCLASLALQHPGLEGPGEYQEEVGRRQPDSAWKGQNWTPRTTTWKILENSGPGL